jgi:hypothetical protein
MYKKFKVLTGSAMEYHRTLAHSVITAFVILLLCIVIEAVASCNKKRSEHLLYEIESTDDDVLLGLSGALSSEERNLRIDFRGTKTKQREITGKGKGRAK